MGLGHSTLEEGEIEDGSDQPLTLGARDVLMAKADGTLHAHLGKVATARSLDERPALR